MRLEDWDVMDYICLYGKQSLQVSCVVLLLAGCAAESGQRIEQMDRADNVQRSFESSAAAAEYGVKR